MVLCPLSRWRRPSPVTQTPVTQKLSQQLVRRQMRKRIDRIRQRYLLVIHQRAFSLVLHCHLCEKGLHSTTIHEADRLSVVRSLPNRRINQNVGVEKDPHAVMTEAVVTYRSCMLSTSRLNYGPTIGLLRGSVIGSLRNRTQGSRNPTRDGSQLLGRRRSVSRCSPSALTLRACMLGQDPEVGFD